MESHSEGSVFVSSIWNHILRGQSCELHMESHSEGSVFVSSIWNHILRGQSL